MPRPHKTLCFQSLLWLCHQTAFRSKSERDKAREREREREIKRERERERKTKKKQGERNRDRQRERERSPEWKTTEGVLGCRLAIKTKQKKETLNQQPSDASIIYKPKSSTFGGNAQEFTNFWLVPKTRPGFDPNCPVEFPISRFPFAPKDTLAREIPGLCAEFPRTGGLSSDLGGGWTVETRSPPLPHGFRFPAEI